MFITTSCCSSIQTTKPRIQVVWKLNLVIIDEHCEVCYIYMLDQMLTAWGIMWKGFI